MRWKTGILTAGLAAVVCLPIVLASGGYDLSRWEEDYHVFVTPLRQEPALLSVIDKGAGGFTVQGVTLDKEPVDCDFDYRVAAKRLGYEDARLEETTWQEGER